MKEIAWTILPRSKGKTLAMVKLAEKTSAYIVVADVRRVVAIQRLCADLGIDIRFPLTFEEFASGRFSPPGIRSFIIDDVDDLLRYMARGVPVIAATATGGEVSNG